MATRREGRVKKTHRDSKVGVYHISRGVYWRWDSGGWQLRFSKLTFWPSSKSQNYQHPPFSSSRCEITYHVPLLARR